MVKRISMDVHGYRVTFADGGEVWLNDNDVQYFGNDLDVSMKWDGDKLIVLPLTDDIGSFDIGDGTTNMDFKLWAPNSGKLHWDASANVLYIIATTMMGYGSQFQFTPGGVGAGTGISFHNTAQYIRSVAANVLEISGQAYLNVASKLVLANTIALTYAVTPSLLGELALGSDNRLQYCVSTAPIIYKVPFYDYTNTSDVILPTGIGLRLGDKLRLQVSAVVATVLGEFYLDSGDSRLTYSIGGGVEYKCAILDGDGKLRIPLSAVVADTEGQLYHSSTTGHLTFHDGAHEYQIAWWDITYNRLSLTGPIKLNVTLDNYTTEGDLWYNSTSKTLRYYNGTTIKTIQTD